MNQPHDHGPQHKGTTMITWLNRIVDLIENTLVTGLILVATEA